MTDLDLPRRIISAGEEPWGLRATSYQKMSIIQDLLAALEDEEVEFIKGSPLGKLLEIPSKPAWSGTFGLFLLSRQLDVKRKNEIWILFAGNPIRFSIREFKIVTGLKCGRLPTTETKKRKATTYPYFEKLFGKAVDVTIEMVIAILNRKRGLGKETRLKMACLVLVDGILLPTVHYHRVKVVKEHAEMTDDLESFLEYPWGRLSFDMMMTSIKERDPSKLGKANFAVQGLIVALQFVVLEAVPAIGDCINPSGDAVIDMEDDDMFPQQRHALQLKLNHARDIDEACKDHVYNIIRPEVEFDDAEENLSWADDAVDPKVDNMLKLISEGFKFKGEMFVGGTKPSEIPAPAKSRKGPIGRNAAGRRIKGKERDIGSSTSNPEESVLIELIEAKLCEHDIIQQELFAAQLAENNKVLIAFLTKWLTDNTVIEEQVISSSQSPNPTTEGESQSDGSQGNETAPGDQWEGACPASPLNSDVNPNCGATVEEIVSFYSAYNIQNERGSISEFVEPRPNKMADTTGPVDQTTREQEAEEVVLEAGRCDFIASADQVFLLNPSAGRLDKNSEEELVQIQPIFGVHKPVHGNMSEDHEGMGSQSIAEENHPNKQVANVINPPENITDFGTESILNENIEEALLPGIDDENAVKTAIPPDATRKSKRTRTVSTRLDERFICDKRIKTLIGQKTAADIENARKLEEKVLIAINSVKRSLNLGNLITISVKEITDLLERHSNTPAKVIDGLLKFSRHMLRNDMEGGERLRVDVLDSKFVAQLTKLYSKFNKSAVRDAFQFNKVVVDSLTGVDEPDRVQPYAEADFLYLPFNFDKRHWVALAIDLKEKKIEVLDSNVALINDSRLVNELQPIATMLPYLFKQVSANVAMSQIEVSPFSIERVSGIQQVTLPPDAGIFSIFLIQTHAIGGVEACRDLEVALLESETKKLLYALINHYSV